MIVEWSMRDAEYVHIVDTFDLMNPWCGLIILPGFCDSSVCETWRVHVACALCLGSTSLALACTNFSVV